MVIEKTDFRDARTIDGSSLVSDLRAPIITPPSVYHEVTRMTRYRGQRAFSNMREAHHGSAEGLNTTVSNIDETTRRGLTRGGGL